MWPNPQETAALVIFTEETFNGKLHFLCNVGFCVSRAELWIILIIYFSKPIDYTSNIMSKRHRVFNESSIIFFFKYTKNLELTQNSKLRDFRRSFFGHYIHVMFIS